MAAQTHQLGPWHVQCLPDDGGRLSVLRFEEHDLLTTAPADFRRPAGNYGLYETRPVYGYDDCLPTVDPCSYPRGARFEIADHGELCWLPWRVAANDNELKCSVCSRQLPIAFRRTMVFGDRDIDWRFEIENTGDTTVVCQHVMHPMMPRGHVCGLALPSFSSAYDEMRGRDSDWRSPQSLRDHLLASTHGCAEMLLLRGIDEGRFEIEFTCGLTLLVDFPVELFPTLGIWWNHGGYPDEDGCRRIECAIEPIPGTSSCLEATHKDGVHLAVEPHDWLRWSVHWEMRS